MTVACAQRANMPLRREALIVLYALPVMYQGKDRQNAKVVRLVDTATFMVLEYAAYALRGSIYLTRERHHVRIV